MKVARNYYAVIHVQGQGKHNIKCRLPVGGFRSQSQRRWSGGEVRQRRVSGRSQSHATAESSPYFPLSLLVSLVSTDKKKNTLEKIK